MEILLLAKAIFCYIAQCPTASANPHKAEVPNSEMQLDIYFSHVWLFVLLSLALKNDPQKKKKKKNPQPLQDASHLQWDPHHV